MHVLGVNAYSINTLKKHFTDRLMAGVVGFDSTFKERSSASLQQYVLLHKLPTKGR